jgi:hypothetical protein
MYPCTYYSTGLPWLWWDRMPFLVNALADLVGSLVPPPLRFLSFPRHPFSFTYHKPPHFQPSLNITQCLIASLAEVV